MKPELPVDHVAFGTRSLEQAMEIITRSGLSMTPIGEAQWPGEAGERIARTVSVVTDDGYLDVIESDRAEDVLAVNGVVLSASDIGDAR